MSWRTLLILSLLLAALLAWDRSLTARREVQREQTSRVGPLLDEDPFLQRQVAAVRLDSGDDVHLYVFHDGLWRCVTYHNAPALNEPIEAIIPALINAQGVIRSTDPADAPSFGFDDQHPLRLSVSGSEVFTHHAGDVIYAFDLGRSILATGGSYVRPVNTDTIWAIDHDFHHLLAPDETSSIPPMLEPHIVPRTWPGVRQGPTRLTIQHGDRTIQITREPADPADDGLQWQWHVQEGAAAYLGDVLQVTSYAVFLTRAPFADVLPPQAGDPYRLGNPLAVITDEIADGPPLQLIIGGPGPGGGPVVLNSLTGVAYEIEPDITGRMLPDIDLLLDGERGNPWEPWLRR